MTPGRASEPKSGQLHHKALSAYYDHLISLKSYLQAYCHREIVVPDDPLEYRHLLDHSICATQEAQVSPYDRHYLEDVYIGTQQEAIHQALCIIAKNGHRNILLNREKSTTQTYSHGRLAELGYGASSHCATFHSRAWKILRSRIGDDLFRHLLVYNSLFTLAQNNCYVQLCGQAICDLPERALPLVKEKKRKATSKRKAKRFKVELQTAEPRPRASRPSMPSPADRHISRQKMFYGVPITRKDGKVIPGLHPRHILNELKPQQGSSPPDTACLRLLRNIFPSLIKPGWYRGDRHTKFQGSERRLEGMIGMMRELLVRHSRLEYGRILRRFVVLSRDHTIEGLQAVSHRLVCRYIAAVLHEVLSTTIVGSKHNLQILIRHARLVIDAKQFEPISLHDLMRDLRIDGFSWLALEDSAGRVGPDESQKRRRLVEDFVFWLFNEYLIPLLKSSFYITETASTRYETVYYDHQDWIKATQPYFAGLKRTLLEPINPSLKRDALYGPLGVSAVRLIPKPNNGFRPIVNLGRAIGTGGPTFGGKSKSANDTLTDVHQILSFEKDRQKDQLGSSLFGTNEIFGPLASLKSELLRIHGKIPRLYFVKMDIKAAFDTIKQDRMLQIIMTLLSTNDEYALLLYALLLPPASKASKKSSRKLFKSFVRGSDDVASFLEGAKDISEPLRNAVMCDLSRRRTISKDYCLTLLERHLKHNTLQVGSDLFRQKEGIPQGSKISSLLCSIFYAALERQYLGFVHQKGSHLLRYIDDFLFITTDLHLAKHFIKVMSKGFPEYGAFISPSKTLVNFEYTSSHFVAPVCQLNAFGSSLFPYCGFLIDTRTLDMSIDHERILAGHMSNASSLRFTRNKGSAFVGWLSRQFENRNHIAYLDTQHNDISTIWLNIFVNFATTATKIPHYFSSSDLITPSQAKVIYDSLCLAVEYTYIAGKARVRHATRYDQIQHYRVRKRDFAFVAKKAILMILSRKPGRFKDVVHLLQKDLSGKDYRNLDSRLELSVINGWAVVKAARF